MTLDESRLLVLTTVGALAPISYRGKLRWRIGASCVEVDPVTWRAQTLKRIGYDWSAEPSGHVLADARPTALEIARRYLRERDTETTRNLADARDRDLLTRLDLLDTDELLTVAGSLLFVETPFVGLDYMHREMPGGNSTERIESTGPLLEQVWEAERAGRVANRMTHVEDGFVHRQVRAIPERVLREAIVNGIAHRDWLTPQPTIVEHVANTVTVTSLGGFIGGVTPDNAITHPAVPRYRSLAAALATLGLAERQGVGIDRMVAGMLAIGRPPPVISEVAGPYVRVALLGGAPDHAMVRFVAGIEPPSAVNVETLLLIEAMCAHGWIDAVRAGPLLQRTPDETAQAFDQLLEARVDNDQPIAKVNGVPSGHAPAFRLCGSARVQLAHRMKPLHTPAGRDAMFVAWATARGRISSAKAADLAEITPGYANQRLAALARSGDIAPSRANRTGRGFHYVPTANGP